MDGPAEVIDDVEYPTSDGKPMAETDVHRDLMIRVIELLKDYFSDRPDVYVSGNLIVYYEKGNNHRHRSPDAMVVFGIPKRDREVFKTWEEGAYPSFILEITSRSTRNEDVREKHQIYQDIWKVQEYFLFDPIEEYLKPSFQGFRLVDGKYEPIVMQHGQLMSEVLGLRLGREGVGLLFREPGSGRVVLRKEEERARKAELALEIAELRAKFSADELEIIEMERDTERRAREEAETAKQAAEIAKQVAEARAEAERKAREDAEAEITRLKAELEAARKVKDS